MPRIIHCKNCQQKLKADEKLFGKTVKCPKCSSPIQIPAPENVPTAPANDIGDLLDDALAAPQVNDEVAATSTTRHPKCSRCGDELTPGSRYCVVCGHNNVDGDAALGQVALQFDERQQKLEAMQRPRHWLRNALLFWTR